MKTETLQERLDHLGTLHRTLSRANDAMARVKDLDSIFLEICRIAVEDGGFRMAWVGLVDADTGFVRPVAHWGIEDGYLDSVRITARDEPEGRGPTGTAIRLGVPVTCEDFLSDPSMLPWREPALRRGYRSSAAVPLRTRHQVLGALTLYAAEPAFFVQDEIDLLGALAADVNLAAQAAEDERLRQDAEGELRRAHAELEIRVQERTRELEAANHELEAFSYSISHDLRAPLRAVNGLVRLILEDYSAQLPAEGQRYLRLLTESADHMDRLVEDLLSFARLSRQPLSRIQVEPGPLVHGVLDHLSAAQRDRQIEIVITDLPPCEADPALLRQVFVNLLSNALKYTRPRAQARIEVGWVDDSGTPAYYVRDNGVGFDLEHARNLFGVFQRFHSAEQFEGTGVGLANVQRIVHRHGGRIWAESAVDRGATFYFTLGPNLANNAELQPVL